MLLKNKNILLISPEPWGINHVSKHHYAIELAKRGNDVYFLNPPTNKFNLRREKNKLFIFDYKPAYRGLSKLPNFLSAILIKKQIEKLETISHATFDIIWNFDSSSFFNLKLLKSKLRISHIVDFNQEKNIKLINQHADICLATSEYILDRQKIYNSNAYNIGHGYAFSKNITPIELPKTGENIKVGYIGNLLIKYLDWELIYKLVTENPEIHFFFAGPYKKSNISSTNEKPYFLGQTMNKENTSFLGSIHSSKINSFLSQMDILLLCYKAEKYLKQLANPHKMMEYLGSGKTVVSTMTIEYKMLAKDGLIVMTDSNETFPALFNGLANNLSYYNNVENTQKRKQFANSNTYNNQITKIEELIKEYA